MRSGFAFADELFNTSCTVLCGVVPRTMNLQEDPLCPLVELFVGGADASACIVTKAKSAQLTTHVGNVRLGIDARMNAGGDGVLFCGQTKTVVAQGVKNIEALHSFEPGIHVCADVAKGVADVKTSTRGVREHVENEGLWFAGQTLYIFQRPGGVWRVICTFGVPSVLPT